MNRLYPSRTIWAISNALIWIRMHYMLGLLICIAETCSDPGVFLNRCNKLAHLYCPLVHASCVNGYYSVVCVLREFDGLPSSFCFFYPPVWSSKVSTWCQVYLPGLFREILICDCLMVFQMISIGLLLFLLLISLTICRFCWVNWSNHQMTLLTTILGAYVC